MAVLIHTEVKRVALSTPGLRSFLGISQNYNKISPNPPELMLQTIVEVPSSFTPPRSRKHGMEGLSRGNFANKAAGAG